MSKIIYTVGYAGFNIDNFIKTLRKYKISCLIDVRSIPKSSYYKDFNKTNLSNVLNDHDILYRNYSREFGARQSDENYYTDGVLDFAKFVKSFQFLEGVQKIEEGVNLGYTFVLMCSEKRPEVCHRNIMVARQFYLKGYEVRNIIEYDKYTQQNEIEQILINKYFPNRNQLSLFDNLSEKEMINQSYQKRNKEIGYRLESVKNEQDLYNRFY